VFVENLTSHPVKNYRQVMNLLEIGSEARTTASTNMNATSSRSHAVFTLTLRSEIEDPATPGQTHERTSKISLVDLAGSEVGIDEERSDELTTLKVGDENRTHS